MNATKELTVDESDSALQSRPLTLPTNFLATLPRENVFFLVGQFSGRLRRSASLGASNFTSAGASPKRLVGELVGEISGQN